MTTPTGFRIRHSTYKKAERLINISIHELVFAMQHISQDDPEDAINCLELVRHHCVGLIVKLEKRRK